MSVTSCTDPTTAGALVAEGMNREPRSLSPDSVKSTTTAGRVAIFHEKLLRHAVRAAEKAGGLTDALEDREAADDIVRWINRTYDNPRTKCDEDGAGNAVSGKGTFNIIEDHYIMILAGSILIDLGESRVITDGSVQTTTDSRSEQRPMDANQYNECTNRRRADGAPRNRAAQHSA